MTNALMKFGFAPGNYLNHCTLCGREFSGDKRATHCMGCAHILKDDVRAKTDEENRARQSSTTSRKEWLELWRGRALEAESYCRDKLDPDFSEHEEIVGDRAILAFRTGRLLRRIDRKIRELPDIVRKRTLYLASDSEVPDYICNQCDGTGVIPTKIRIGSTSGGELFEHSQKTCSRCAGSGQRAARQK